MAQVLLVDDNGSVLLTLAIALRRRGHEVTTAVNGTEALSFLYHQPFDVVVSDVSMPDMSGIQLANMIRQREGAPRVILTSAYSTLEAHRDIAEAFLRKPVDVAELDELLQHPPRDKNDRLKTRRRTRRRFGLPSLHSSRSQTRQNSSYLEGSDGGAATAPSPA